MGVVGMAWDYQLDSVPVTAASSKYRLSFLCNTPWEAGQQHRGSLAIPKYRASKQHSKRPAAAITGHLERLLYAPPLHFDCEVGVSVGLVYS